MTDSPDVVIIGAGLMGAAAAWALSRRGVPVIVVEQFAPDHVRGSSHGAARIVRRAYADRLYVDLAGRAFELWDAIEAASGASLIRLTGGLDFGAKRHLDAIADHLSTAGVPVELLSADAAQTRWPGMRFAGDVLFHPQAGTLDADAAVTTLLSLARASGAEVRHGCRAESIQPSQDAATVVLEDGTPLRARHVVVAAGAWVRELVGGLVRLPDIHVTQQQVFHFPRLAPEQPPWPSTIHEDATAIYHLAGGGASDDRKVGEHITRGMPTTADTRTFVIDSDARRRVIEYVRRWLPGLSPEPHNEATCLYTTTPSEDFILDRVGPIAVCSPCSGHGAKFAPLIGELVSSIVRGEDGVPPRFSLAAHLAGQAGPVSL